MSEIRKHVRQSVLDLKPYQPGKPIEEVQRELGLPSVIKLASNEYPEGPFPEVIEAVGRAVAEGHRYPDPSCYTLTRTAAKVFGVDEKQLFFGNGNNEILELLVHLLCGPGDRVVFARPSFPIYGLICQSHFDCGVSVPLNDAYVHDLPAMADAIDERTRIVFICNPNNPTSTYVNHAALEAFLQRVPKDVLVALDEPYVDFVTAADFPDFFALQKRFDNLVSLRSFSKTYSLAGLRIGYLIGSPEIVELLHRVRQPFNVNALAQVAATVAVQQQHRVVERRQRTVTRLRVLREGLEAMGCSVLPSQTNFLCVLMPEDSLQIFERLLREGVIVRPMHQFGLPLGSFRVSAGTEPENERFLQAIGKILGSSKSV